MGDDKKRKRSSISMDDNKKRKRSSRSISMDDNKKRKRSSHSISIDGLDYFLKSVIFPSKRVIREESSTTTTSEDLKFIDTLKCVSKIFKEQLGRLDDAFSLSWTGVLEVQIMFISNRWPTRKEFLKWDPYTKVFYLKMLTCCDNKPPFDYESLKPKVETLSEKSTYASSEEDDDDDSSADDSFPRLSLKLPLEFGRYAPKKSPNSIPYHLYLLVKKAVDIMKHDEWRSKDELQTDLIRVERKIRFFCNYFHSHLPTGWKYNREDASTDIAGYDPTRKPKYDMSGYTPISSFTGTGVSYEYDEKSGLSRPEMLAIMCIIHSRETPVIWKLSNEEIEFYCKICSCFGIDYLCLEAASEDDVCLMNVGLEYPPSV